MSRTLQIEMLDDRWVMSITSILQLNYDGSGNLQFIDIAAKNNQITLSRESGFYVLTDANGTANTQIDATAVPSAVVDAANLNRVKIPDSAFISKANAPLSLTIKTNAGNDIVNIDTTNSASPLPPAGLSVDLGNGNDTLALVNNTSDNIWKTTGPQDGIVTLGDGLGVFTFAGLEHAVGSAGKDAFRLKYSGQNGIQSIDGGDATNPSDMFQATRAGSFTLTNSKFSFVPTATSQAAGQQTQAFNLINIKSANLLGSQGNDVFDVSGWTHQGDNTAANYYGGLVLGGGGIDRVIKRADLTSAIVGDTNLETSDGMHMLLAGNTRPTVQDTSPATPFSVDLSNLNLVGGQIIANGNINDEIKITTSRPSIAIDDQAIHYTNGFDNHKVRIDLSGFNQTTITGDSTDQTAWFRNTSWLGTQTFDGAGGDDQVIVSADQNLIMEPTRLTLGNGPTAFKINLTNVESFKYKGFDPSLGPTASHDNTITLSDWNQPGIIEAGDGNDRLVVDHSTATVNQIIELKPAAMTINGVILQLVKNAPATFDAHLTGGSGNDTLTLNNWRGTATIDGTSGNDTLSVQCDRDMDFNPHQVVIKKQIGSKAVDKNIDYSNIDNLTAAGGDGENVFTLNPGYDAGLTADTTGFTLVGNGGKNIIKTSIDADISVTANIPFKLPSGNLTTISTFVIGPRTLTFTHFQTPQAVDFEPKTTNTYSYTFKDYQFGTNISSGFGGSGIIDGAKQLTFSFDDFVHPNRATFTSQKATFDNMYQILNLGTGGLCIHGGSEDDYFDASDFEGNISIDGGAGNDTIYGGKGNDILFGGDGNDTIYGNLGNDWISGESGHDVLIGGLGRDILVGGAGNDKLNTLDGFRETGGDDDDMLIGGSTKYDRDLNAIAAILAAWTNNATYDDRVQQITVIGVGDKKQYQFDNTTLISDKTLGNAIFGGKGQDWVSI